MRSSSANRSWTSQQSFQQSRARENSAPPVVAERRDCPEVLAKIRAGRTGFVPGLSVFQTLHLVSDNRNSYKMF
ncbi:hypothetical protein MA5S0422_3905 [Mycobacteroides abscessus 5S-0422]|uniref:Uncharacterized protein n=1 Tax=Mycobacteroides abscessus subsp. bolletii 1513 TaxID=1299321 RepID=X8DF31_9MYCO|nr:hypothetical protein MA5S0422_3905 [Mycobacteroides abscessus 5S-0422]EIU06187.1 hypothetical protein MA5S0421_2985 [Mycobacteroides abscessus 5S-0421]EIU09799.1 hypothetical protein MA5S0304_2731 [Mycobacteroides abscessus 5S-0304]EIU20764.1 hypothetical protein MA5S0708_2658 [Mycobacteroides abscessus 5S-0708]EIU29019.1 hypothetical protein MA5S1212_2412 [Mycobacteroides abscessus 5S-1212]EIU43574.1 hypothetical protein MA5S1215_2768 [Mycobacteroides abscessus 5S-1215]EIU88087.1 hypothet